MRLAHHAGGQSGFRWRLEHRSSIISRRLFYNSKCLDGTFCSLAFYDHLFGMSLKFIFFRFCLEVFAPKLALELTFGLTINDVVGIQLIGAIYSQLFLWHQIFFEN